MTSGQFQSVETNSIFVDREKRQRKELKNIEELAASIAANGLIHPPVIRRSGELVVGERRWTAVKLLGWTHIPIQWVDELSEIELQAIEYEENIRRVDLPWEEQCLAVEHYHNLRAQQDTAWTASATAEALGVTAAEVGHRRAVAKELLAGNERVKAAPKYSTARGIVERETARRKASVVSSIEAAVAPEVVQKKVPPLLNEDFHVWASAYTSRPFNFIHCDFPYGVAMHKSDQGAGAAHGTYADSPDVYWALLDTLRQAMDNVVADSAHLMFWFSMDYYADTKKMLEAMGWKINPFPLVWVKSDNTGILPDAKRGPRRIYETALFGSRGDRNIVGPVSNAVFAPGREKSVHMNEKPVVMLRHFMRMFVDEYSTVLDPTAGSANALKAATSLGAPTVLGLERDPEFFNRACEAYYGETDELCS